MSDSLERLNSLSQVAESSQRTGPTRLSLPPTPIITTTTVTKPSDGKSPTSPTSPVLKSPLSPQEAAQLKPKSILKSPGGKRNSSMSTNSARIIKTFEEVEVLKTVLAEEWYEELECGICSHILGATQALVPCGHSFCGPCAWQWIIINKNITCPHCRTQVLPEMPLVPNIIVDQIVDRKLQGLPDGSQKEDLRAERGHKAKAWEVLHANMPTKPKRKSKGFEEWFGFFDQSGSHSSGNSPNAPPSRNGRATSAYVDLTSGGDDERRIQNLIQGGMTLGAIRRMEAEQLAILRRAGGPISQMQFAQGSRTESREDMRARSRQHRVQLVSSPTPSPPETPPRVRPPTLRAETTPTRATPPRLESLRSNALTARQSRWRSPNQSGQSGRQNDPIRIGESDEES